LMFEFRTICLQCCNWYHGRYIHDWVARRETFVMMGMLKDVYLETSKRKPATHQMIFCSLDETAARKGGLHWESISFLPLHVSLLTRMPSSVTFASSVRQLDIVLEKNGIIAWMHGTISLPGLTPNDDIVMLVCRCLI
jgi:hypothetical protein